ncbi:MAG: FG-GAP-like repeat-containing protein, partial [Ignavibacteria bacterium]|nr:FG-GAP-like repeat-containing protein [Ignavibacteria bacterium]
MMPYRITLTVFFGLLLVSAASAGPGIIAVSPQAQTMTADVMTEVSIEFDTPIDPATVNGSTIMISGRWSGIPGGLFSLEDSNRVVRFVPTEPFSAGEWVTVSISRGVQGEGADSLDAGYAWTFWTASAPGTLDQTLLKIIEVREPGEPHIQTYGAHAADLNNDGWTDLTLPNEISDDIRVFLNDGLGDYSGFSIHPVPNGNFASANEAVDMDGDGDLDFVVGNGGNDRMCVFIGDGSGGFESA